MADAVGTGNKPDLTAQEQELKRAEMARRRKNLTDQRLEEEKVRALLPIVHRLSAHTNFYRWTPSIAFSKSKPPKCAAVKAGQRARQLLRHKKRRMH